MIEKQIVMERMIGWMLLQERRIERIEKLIQKEHGPLPEIKLSLQELANWEKDFTTPDPPEEQK